MPESFSKGALQTCYMGKLQEYVVTKCWVKPSRIKQPRNWQSFLPSRLRKVEPLKGKNNKEHRKLWKEVIDIFIILIVAMVSQGSIHPKIKKKVSE